jgi:hypothetical protein
VEPTLDRRQETGHLDLAERRKPTYVQVSQPGRTATVLAWFAALAVVLSVGSFALYGLRYEHFVMANGGYVLRLNRFTGKACYIPTDPEWERVLVNRQALLDRCY